jgi:hypothetical protein
VIQGIARVRELSIDEIDRGWEIVHAAECIG